MMIVTQLKTLRKKSSSLKTFDKNLEILLLNELLYYKTGVGLAAIQIGIPSRMCIIKSANHQLRQVEYLTLWNPIITSKMGMEFGEEGCLSLPGETISVPRFNNIDVTNGDGKKFHFKGFTAKIVQHEIDHMDGVIIIDYKSEDSSI